MLTCSAMRSRNVLPSFTTSKLFAFSKPMDVPRPPFSLMTAVWSSRSCKEIGFRSSSCCQCHRYCCRMLQVDALFFTPFEFLQRSHAPSLGVPDLSCPHLDLNWRNVGQAGEVWQALSRANVAFRDLCRGEQKSLSTLGSW